MATSSGMCMHVQHGCQRTQNLTVAIAIYCCSQERSSVLEGLHRAYGRVHVLTITRLTSGCAVAQFGSYRLPPCPDQCQRETLINAAISILLIVSHPAPILSEQLQLQPHR
jgi:hypothetical protein